MKKSIFLSVFVTAITIIACNQSSSDNKQSNTADTSHQHETNAAMYQCPMHPEITSDKPGACSECGMDLEKK